MVVACVMGSSPRGLRLHMRATSLRRPAAGVWVRRAARAARRHAPRPVRRALAVASSLWGLGEEHPWDDQVTDRRKVLLNFVQQVEPGVMQKFEDATAPQVVTAMRQTVTNILGTLPPQFFRVTISTAGENLAQLFYSVVMTGYMFRNAWYRLELRKSMGGAGALAAAAGGAGGPGRSRAAELVGSSVAEGSVDDDYRPTPQYAPGSQMRGVEGEVVRWVVDSGPEVTPAVQYIEQLEREVASLRQQIAEQATALDILSSNELMDYLKTLDAGQLQELTSCAGEDVLEAMNTFIQRLMASEEEDWKSGHNDCTAVELAQVLYWLMVVGYQLRMLEVRLDMRTQFESDSDDGSSGPFRTSLPPGRW